MLIRYIMSLCASDFTGQVWLSGFNEMGQLILGKSANEMHELKEITDGGDAEFNRIVQSAMGKTYNFNLRAKADTFKDETRVRYHIQRAAVPNYAEAANQMCDTMEKLGF